MTYRRIIIPKGTIVSNQTTIIRVPNNLDADAVVVGPKRSTFLESDTLSNALPIHYVPNDFGTSDIISNNPEDTIVLPIKIVMPFKNSKYIPMGRGQIYQTPSKMRKRQIPYVNRSTPWMDNYSTGNSNLLTDVNTQYEVYPFSSSGESKTFPSSQYGNVSKSSHESYMNMDPHQNSNPSNIQRSYSDYSNRFGSPNRTYTTSNRNFDTRGQPPNFYFPVPRNKTEIQLDHNDYNFPDEFSTYVAISKRDFTQMFPEITQNNPYLGCIYEEDTDVYTEEDDEDNKDSEIKSNPTRSRSCHQNINNPIREASLIINSAEEDAQMELETLLDHHQSSDLKYK